MRFGRLVVLKQQEKRSRWDIKCECLCDCGKFKLINSKCLRSGETKSCGCLHKEKVTKHGFSLNYKTDRFFSIYLGIKGRCNNPNIKCYKNYGGRGIKNEWDKFEDFKNDMYESYLKHINDFGTKQTTIDRINVNKNYNKENCRWATYKEQAINKRKHINTPLDVCMQEV